MAASESLQLILFSGFMFVGSYFAGLVPLMFSLGPEKLEKISVLGAGLLVGTALAVIIPEGAQTLIKSYISNDSPKHRQGQVDEQGAGRGPRKPFRHPRRGKTDHHEHGHEHEHEHSDMEGLDKCIGVSLVLGFVFMLLIDQMASSRSSGSATDTESDSGGGSTPKKKSWTTTLGLVVHAAADGIALGAAATINQTDVEIIVFLAIMLHKAPAAFGLTTFLLHEGMDRLRAKRHLLIFSLSAPITAMITFLLLHPSNVIKPTGGHLDTFRATGIAMLFSAGTFLYVATVHVLPEVVGSSKDNNKNHSHGHHGSTGFSKCDLLLLVLGTLMPMILTLGHHH